GIWRVISTRGFTVTLWVENSLCPSIIAHVERNNKAVEIVRQWVSGVLFILVVFAFQVSSIPFVHMHPDEELSYRATEGTLADTLHYQMSLQDNQAPGWFVTFWAWR